LGRKANLINISPRLIESLAAMLGKRAAAQRLLGNLTASPQALREELNWKPAFTVQAGMKETADWYMQQGQLKL
jgi:UDP-glucose 4-epimerase